MADLCLRVPHNGLGEGLEGVEIGALISKAFALAACWTADDEGAPSLDALNAAYGRSSFYERYLL